MKKKLISLSVVICILSLCGCSYSEIDNAIKKEINEDPNVQQTTIDENGVERNVMDTSITYEGFIFVGANETFPDYYSYTDEFGELQEDGIKGLTYTLRNVSIYDSVENSPINPNICTYSNYDDAFETMIQHNSFVLVDMSASYEATDSAIDIIQPILEFSGSYHIGDGFNEFIPSTANDGYGSENYTSIEPRIIYFSQQPIEGDKDINGKPIDVDKSSNWFRTPLKKGESVDFQLGILCSEELIKDENVFLIHRYETPPSEEEVYQIDLFGRLTNAQDAQN